MSYLKLFSRRTTPQSEPIPGSEQVQNHAGGFVFAVDDWVRLQRFLVLGNEGGTYYQKQQAMTRENAGAVLRCLQADGQRLVREVVEVSTAGRAPKNDPALFVLALALSFGDDTTKHVAAAAIPRVARIGTHLLHLVAFLDGLRGWGRGLRKAIAAWYNAMPAEKLAYQVLKYQQRDGWSHRDVLRLAHPQAPTPQHQILYHWITQGWESAGDEPHDDPVLRQVRAAERAKVATSEGVITELIERYDLPREAVPTEWLRPPVWAALAQRMPLTALIRNLGTLTAQGVIAPFSTEMYRVVERLTNAEALKAARIHPIAVLAAMLTYAQGHGERGKQTWTPVPQIVDALDKAFYLTFANAPATGKRWFVGLDVSGSMSMGTIAGVPGLTPRKASCALALVLTATEPNTVVATFNTELRAVNISARQRLDDVITATDGWNGGGTDCAQPMIYAMNRKIPVDVFVVITDNETWAGGIHPSQALQQYRAVMGIPAKLIVIGMTATRFSIADPNDAGMLDVVGFDTAVPALMAQFAEQGTATTPG
jgi:60 kDa SS-A/Ro ribonucleoprotein